MAEKEIIKLSFPKMFGAIQNYKTESAYLFIKPFINSWIINSELYLTILNENVLVLLQNSNGKTFDCKNISPNDLVTSINDHAVLYCNMSHLYFGYLKDAITAMSTKNYFICQDIEFCNSINVTKATFFQEKVIILSDTGSIYMFGINTLEHYQVCALETISSFMHLKIKDVACGFGHCCFLSTFGTVYTQGIGSRGQLGHGDLLDITEPKQVMGLEIVRVLAIACGGWHTVVLSEEGDVYLFGWNDSGQLGLPCGSVNNSIPISSEPVPYEHCYQKNFNDTFIGIGCGTRYTVIWTTEAILYFGHPNFGITNSTSTDLNNSNFVLHFKKTLPTGSSIYTMELFTLNEKNISCICGDVSFIIQLC